MLTKELLFGDLPGYGILVIGSIFSFFFLVPAIFERCCCVVWWPFFISLTAKLGLIIVNGEGKHDKVGDFTYLSSSS